MRLLVLTQKVDKEDPILGFFHNWLIKLSFKFESIVVICLFEGTHDLPRNVKVLSLGKERGVSKFGYLINFYKYIWAERHNYDAVFVHMNEEYVYLGWKLWFILGKKIYMWRNHKKGSLLTRFAVLVSEKVFYTSSESFTAKFKKAVKMPVGIDVEKFKDLKMERSKNAILFLGRFDPVKKVDLFIEALKELKKKGVDFVASIYGDPTVGNEDYYNSQKGIAFSGLGEYVKFYKSVVNDNAPEKYSSHQIYVNLTPSGSFDKTILEAISCGCIPIISNNALGEVLDDSMVVCGGAGDVAEKIKYWLNSEESLKVEWRNKLVNYVLENHSLNALMDKLCIIIRK